MAFKDEKIKAEEMKEEMKEEMREEMKKRGKKFRYSSGKKKRIN